MHTNSNQSQAFEKLYNARETTLTMAQALRDVGYSRSIDPTPHQYSGRFPINRLGQNTTTYTHACEAQVRIDPKPAQDCQPPAAQNDDDSTPSLLTDTPGRYPTIYNITGMPQPTAQSYNSNN